MKNDKLFRADTFEKAQEFISGPQIVVKNVFSHDGKICVCYYTAEARN